MRIVIITNTFLPTSLGGTQIATFNIAKTLARREHEVHVIAKNLSGDKSFEYVDGFFVHRPRFSKKFTYSMGTYLFLYQILLIIKSLKPDLVHAQSMRPNGWYVVLIKKILGIPCVNYVRGSDIYNASEIYKHIVGSFILRNCNRIISLCEDMKRVILKVYNREVCVIPNGICLDVFKEGKRDVIRGLFGFSLEENIVLFVGRLEPIKGVEYLIRAAQQVTTEKHKVKFLIIGEGTSRRKLEKLVNSLNLAEHVIFVGKISNSRVSEYMILSDILVLPSLSESFGIVNLEAMSCGLPIIATNVGGIPEIVENNINGLLVNPKNANQIAEKILEMLENRRKMQIISNNNKAKAKKFSWEHIVDCLEDVYFSLLLSEK